MENMQNEQIHHMFTDMRVMYSSLEVYIMTLPLGDIGTVHSLQSCCYVNTYCQKLDLT